MRLGGHAIECRIYAEDPDNNYFPSPGKINLLMEPSGPGIRIDSGMYEGWTVPIDYDPLLAKLIGYGADREQAIARLTRALGEYFVGGIKTNISLFRRILRDADFRAAKLDTGFLDRMLKRPEDQRSRREGSGSGCDCRGHICCSRLNRGRIRRAHRGQRFARDQQRDVQLEGCQPPRSSALKQR